MRRLYDILVEAVKAGANPGIWPGFAFAGKELVCVWGNVCGKSVNFTVELS